MLINKQAETLDFLLQVPTSHRKLHFILAKNERTVKRIDDRARKREIYEEKANRERETE